MKVNLFVSKDLEEPYAEIYTDALTDNIQKAMVLLENEDEYEEEGIGHHRLVRVVSGHLQRGIVLRQGHLRPAGVPAGAQGYFPREPHSEPRPLGGLPHTLRTDKRCGAL